jgi:pyruvate dehydrogenase E2 component (dihydrolipoamide acetyltransferase)
VARVLRMPEVAANATEAVLAEWLVVETGDFAVGEVIATVETEKALVDVEAEEAGTVLATLVLPGSAVDVGAPIAVLGAPGEQVADRDALLAELGVAEPVTARVPERRDVPEPGVPDVDPSSGAPLAETPPADVPVVVPATPARNGRVFSSPLARKLAAAANLPIEEIPGTGPRNRVLRRDVERAVAARTAVPAPEPPTPAETSVGEVPHSRLRRAVASRLQESKRDAPHFYVRATLRADRLLALRAEVNAAAEVRVSVTDLLVKAVGGAHRRVPEMNVVWGQDAVRTFDTVDVAVAVATDRGLVTPVVRDVGSRTLGSVATDLRDLAERARAGRLRQDELEGGSISITNLGMYGVEEFAAIINPPQAAILAVGAVREAPVVDDGVLGVGRVMTVTLSVDHRPVDGVVAARWLAAFQELVEHPAAILC